jgi:hypothetical protein
VVEEVKKLSRVGNKKPSCKAGGLEFHSRNDGEITLVAWGTITTIVVTTTTTVTAATTTITATAAATATTTWWTLFTRSSFVDRHATTSDFLLIQAFDGRQRFIMIGHLDKGKASRSPRFSVRNNADPTHLAILAESLPKFFFRCAVRQVSNIDIRHRTKPSNNCPRRSDQPSEMAQSLSTREPSPKNKLPFPLVVGRAHLKKSDYRQTTIALHSWESSFPEIHRPPIKRPRHTAANYGGLPGVCQRKSSTFFDNSQVSFRMAVIDVLDRNRSGFRTTGTAVPFEFPSEARSPNSSKINRIGWLEQFLDRL